MEIGQPQLQGGCLWFLQFSPFFPLSYGLFWIVIMYSLNQVSRIDLVERTVEFLSISSLRLLEEPILYFRWYSSFPLPPSRNQCFVYFLSAGIRPSGLLIFPDLF